LPDVPENSGMVLTPTQQEMDQFEPYILRMYRKHWAEHGAFIVRPPTQLKLDVKCHWLSHQMARDLAFSSKALRTGVFSIQLFGRFSAKRTEHGTPV
jgi:hypothetical protein